MSQGLQSIVWAFILEVVMMRRLKTELEGMWYEAFRAMGMRVPGRVVEAGEGESVVESRDSVFENH